MFMEIPKAVYFKELIFHEEKLSRICLFLREYILLILTADNFCDALSLWLNGLNFICI